VHPTQLRNWVKAFADDPGFSRTATDVSFLADAVEKCRGVVGFAIGRVSACSWLDVGA
jgi:hypothetical protein